MSADEMDGTFLNVCTSALVCTNSTTEEDSPYNIDLNASNLIRTSLYYALLMPIAIIGNAFTIRVSVRILRHRKIPNLLTLALAISDLIGVCLVHLPVLVALIAGRWLGGIFTCAYQYLMAWSFLKLSFFILVLMTIDRYLALCKPFYYHKNANSKRMIYAVTFLAALSFLGTSVTIISHAHTIFMLKTWYMCMNTWSSTDTYYTAILIFYGSTFIIFIGVFIFCNVSVVLAMIKRSKAVVNLTPEIKGQNRLPGNLTAREKREKRFAQIIILLSIVFLICWTPYLAFIILRQTMIYTNDVAEDFTIRLVLANTAFNAVITCAFNKTYRQGFWFFSKTMCHKLTGGFMEKPADDSMFYLRRSYLQHRHARRIKSNSMPKERAEKSLVFNRKLQDHVVSRDHDSHVSEKEQHWLVISSKKRPEDFCYDAQIPSPNEDDANQDSLRVKNRTEDDKDTHTERQPRQIPASQGKGEIERIRCKLTVDINLDLERSGTNGIEAKTVYLALNLETMSCDTKV